MVHQEISDADVRQWDQVHHNSRKSVVVVTIYDSDEDESSSSTATCSTPDESLDDRSSPEITQLSTDYPEIAIIQIGSGSKVQAAPLHLADGCALPLLSTTPVSAVNGHITGDNLSLYDVTVGNIADLDNADLENNNSANMLLNDNVYITNPKLPSDAANAHECMNPLAAKNFIIKLKEQATQGELFRELTPFVERYTAQTACNYQTVKDLLNSYGVINDDCNPLDYSKGSRILGEENHEHTVYDPMMTDNYAASDYAGSDQGAIDAIIVDDVDMDSELVEDRVDNTSDDCVDETEPHNGVIIDAFGTADADDIDEDSVRCNDVESDGVDGDISGGNYMSDECNTSDVPTNTVEQFESPPNNGLPDYGEMIDEDTLPCPMQRRSKRIPLRQAGVDNKKQKCSETSSGRTRAKQFSKKACANPQAGTRRAEAKTAASAEKRGGGVRRGGVATRARARHMLSVGAVWQRPTAADLGRRRTWPVHGMHERPVWPLARDSPAPSSPPRPSRTPSPDPAELARQRDIEIRLHWGLAACYQVYRDAREVGTSFSPVSLSNPQTCTNTPSPQAENKSVQDIYIESRLYKFFDNEMSKIFLKNGSARYTNSKVREHISSMRSNQTQTNLMPYFYSQGPMLESLRNFLQKNYEVCASSSEVGDRLLDNARDAYERPDTSRSGSFEHCHQTYTCNSRLIHFTTSENNNNVLQHSSSLYERKREVLEKITCFIEENLLNSNVRNSFNSHETSVMSQNYELSSVNHWNNSSFNIYERFENRMNRLDDLENNDKKSLDASSLVYFKNDTAYITCAIDSRTILDALCCVLYSLCGDYCKINNIKSDDLVKYIDCLTPRLLTEWVETNIQYENERL